MTKDSALKSLARTRMKHTGENYTQAVAVTKVRLMPNVDMMTRREMGVSMNGSLDGAVLASYGPLMEAISNDWTLLNAGPYINQFVLEGGLTSEDSDQVALYAATVSEPTRDEGEIEDFSDYDYMDDVLAMPCDVKLEDCARFYLLESTTIHGEWKNLFPKGDLPEGCSWIDGMGRATANNEVGVKVLNDGPDFIKNIAILMNWIAENVHQGTSSR